MSKALSRNSRRSDYDDARDDARAARRSGRSLGDWLDDAIRDDEDEQDEDYDREDRLAEANRRLARASEPRRSQRRWRDDDAGGEDARRFRRSRRDDRYDAAEDEPNDRIDAKAIVDDAAAIVERRIEQSEQQTQQALANLADMIKRSQRQKDPGERDVMRRALAAFTERAEQTERQTARALNNIAGVLENSQRDRVEAENGIVTLAERLARIENRLTEQPGPNAAVRPIRSALSRLESRLDALSREDRTADFENALSGLDQRLAEIARRLDGDARDRDEREARARKQREPGEKTREQRPRDGSERETFERARAAADRMNAVSSDALEQGLRPASPRRPLVDAIAEITRRQRALDEAFGTPPQPKHDVVGQERFDSLKETIESISRQLDGVREDSTERADQQLVAMRQIESLRREVQDMAHAIGDLAPRASISAVENALRDLARRVDTQRDRGVRDDLLAPAERIAAELRDAIRDLDPSPIVRNLHADVETIGRRLDTMQAQSQTSGVDDEALRMLAQHTHDIKQQLSALAARPLPLEKIETRLFDLTQRVDSLSLSSNAAPEMGDVVQSIRSIVSAETNRGFETFNNRLEQLAGKLDDMVLRAGAKRFDDLTARIDELGRTLSTQINHSAAKPVDTAPLEDLVANLAKKIDTALDQKPHGAGFEEIGRKIERLETRIGEAPAQSFARIEEMLQRPLADRQFAELAQRIDLVHKTLASRMEQGAVAAESADMRYIEELVRGLDQKIEAALGAEGKAPDLVGIERQLSQLTYKIDRLENPATAPASFADWQPPAPDHRLDEITDRLERMQSALTHRVEENARAEARHHDLTALVEKLAAQVNRALDPRAEAGALKSLENQIGALTTRLERSGPNGDALAAIEARIGDLVHRIEDTRVATTQAAEEAVRRATQEILREAAAAPGAIRGEVERELTDLRKTQDESGQRTHETLIAVHETLERVVDRLALFEDELSDIRSVAAPVSAPVSTTLSAPTKRYGADDAPPSRASEAPPVAPARDRIEADDDLMDFLLPPGGGATPRREPSLSAPRAPIGETGPEPDRRSVQSDFIAAARRAAQQAAVDADAAEQAKQARRNSRGAASAVSGVANAARKAVRPDAETRPNEGGAQGARKIAATLQERKRPLLIGLAALVLLVGSYEIARVSLNPAPAPAEPAALEEAAEPSASQAESAPATPAPAPAKESPAAKAPASPSAATPAPSAAAPQSPAAPAPSVAAPVANEAPITPLPRMIPPPKAGKRTDMGVDQAPTGALAPQESISAIKAAAVKGDPAAQFEYAARLSEGRGVGRDPKAATQWFEKSATQGVAPAQYRLGSMYEKGVGVERNYGEARKWYQLAAEAGNARAMHNLAVLLAEGGDGKPDYANASGWFRKAAEYGVRDSQYNLAILYARGLGVSQSLQQSYVWFSAAAAQGDEDAGKKRDEVAGRLDSKELAAAKTLAASFKAKPPVHEANDVLPPPGGWESVKDASPQPAAKPAKAKAAQI